MFEPPTKIPDPDAPIRATDNDAAIARLSAVRKGYLIDPYIAALVPRAHLQQPRAPLINIGTYLRSRGIDHLVDGWLRLAGGRKVQIVSLGAGSDTRYWRLANGPHAAQLQRYIEIDFAENTSRKIMSIRKNRVLNAALGNGGSADNVFVGGGGTVLRAPVYNLFPADLRSPPATSLAPILTSRSAAAGNAGAGDIHDVDDDERPMLSPTLPTLLLFECVLAYMDPAGSDALVRWFVDYFVSAPPHAGAPLGAIVYEMFKLNDAFGRVMLNNLKSRNVSLPGAEPYRDLASLSRRLLDSGFATAQAVTLREVRRRYVEPRELQRLAQLELLDEVEELELVLDHYAISWGVRFPEGWREGGGDNAKGGWEKTRKRRNVHSIARRQGGMWVPYEPG
ncbi:leucine carboxyl methyltransferase [Russula earlei]|uniref:Leucine carboxyl methyltransferase n=1 Tax=Russula earlei TaxID=71964 RepID=A0ACC0U9T9_9AGAM|nr:leucine carboxyl methyltransferase [Russula earlei]